MTPIVLWLVGEPGAGKTAIARGLVSPLGEGYCQAPKWTMGQRWWGAGIYKGDPYDGADTIPYNGAKAALEHWSARFRQAPIPRTLLDGDRLSTGPSLEFFQSFPVRRLCVMVEVPSQVAHQRRQERGGRPMSATWLKGRCTKARRFFERFPAGDRLLIDSSMANPVILGQTIESWAESQAEAVAADAAVSSEDASG